MKNIVISGSGLSGLLAALILSENPENKVFIIEKSNQPGGLLKSFDYGENGFFDHGAHNISETGIKEIDQLIFNILEEKQWDILSGNRRDLAGTYINGKLQKHTQYIDLRNFSGEVFKNSVADFFYNLNNSAENNQEDAYHVSLKKFGNFITDNIVDKVVKKIYKKSIKELEKSALKIIPMDRVCMFSEEIIEDITTSKILRSLVAYTDQRKLPVERSSGKSSFYPAAGGMQVFVNAVIKKLKENNVEIITGSSIKNLNMSGDRIHSVEIENQDKFTLETEEVYWSAGLPQIVRLLNLNQKEDTFDLPLKTIICNLLVKDKPEIFADLYYFYCYDEPFKTFRVTNYANYCSGAVRNGLYPLSVELLFENMPENIEEICLNELAEMNIVNAPVSFIKTEPLEAGFPMPTLKNIQYFAGKRAKIAELGIKNLTLLGVFSEKDLIFQTDIMIDTYKKIAANN
jgi:protoporphyrinogen oxidase